MPDPSTSAGAAHLASRRWRLRHSAWMLPVLLLFGIGTWAAFLYIGVRARNRYWIGAGVVYTLATIAYFALAETTRDSTGDRPGWIGGIPAAVYFAGVTHAFIVNRGWLRWRAANDSPWYADQSAPLSAPPAPTAAAPAPLPEPLRSMRIDAQHFYSVSPQPHAAQRPSLPVDVARASPEEFSALPGFNLERGRRVVARRITRGGFRTMDDFMADSELAPHEYVRIRDMVVCSDSDQAPERSPSPGRILDV